MIDWVSRAGAILRKEPIPPTDETDERHPLEGFVGFVSTLPAPFCKNASSPGLATNDPLAATSSRWLIHLTDRDPVHVTFDPPVDHAHALAYPGAIAAVPVTDPAEPEPTCNTCEHISAFGNCVVPGEAGLADTFMLVKHPDGGRGCSAFEHKITVIEQRLRDLIAIAAIDTNDANFCRRRYHDEPAVWDLLLDACEAAVKGDGRDKTR